MFAPIEGIGEVAWGVSWFEFCKQHGPPRGSGRPLLPSPLSGGGWQTSPLNVDSAAKWLRYLLIRAGCDRSSVEALGTHSLKATTLSWCAKFGLDRATRAALGYHSKGRDGTELIYGRDNMAKPVRDMQEVLLQVALGQFDPDATRSGYFLKRGGPPGGEAIPQEEVLSESSSEASEDAEGVNHEAAENAADELGRQQPSHFSGTMKPGSSMRQPPRKATSFVAVGASRHVIPGSRPCLGFCFPCAEIAAHRSVSERE